MRATAPNLLDPAGPDWGLHPADISDFGLSGLSVPSDWMKLPKTLPDPRLLTGPLSPKVFVKRLAQSSCETGKGGARVCQKRSHFTAMPQVPEHKIS